MVETDEKDWRPLTLRDERQRKFLANWLALRAMDVLSPMELAEDALPVVHEQLHKSIERTLGEAARTMIAFDADNTRNPLMYVRTDD